MLMMREHETVEAGGLGSGGAFTIAASTKAFEVLSSNLYQNKTLAVIREITCNAVDAHTVAGLPLTDIKVHLPTYTEPYFAVRDFGSGMSEADIMSLYTTYFRSTKDRDNTQIGGFGLGSKAPFAVSDQFTVTSWHGGTKATYVCYKQDGMPRVNVVGSTPCGSETGLEVRVPLTSMSGSTATWQAEARQLFRWWPALPITNVAILADDGLFTPDNIAPQSGRLVDGAPEWVIFKALAHHTIVMGGVPYSLNEAALKDVPPGVTAILRKVRLAIRVPMGSVSISPSRETLSYDPPTIRFLVDKLKDVSREVVVALEKEIDCAPNLAEARKMVHGRANGGLSYLFLRLKDIVKPRWQGKHIPIHAGFNLDTDFSTQGSAFDFVRKGHWSTFQREASSPAFEHSFPVYDGYVRHVLWTAKVTSKTYATLRHNYQSVPRGQEVRLHVVTGVPYQELVAKCLEKGVPQPINIEAELEVPPKVATGAARLPATQHYPVTVEHGRYSYRMEKSPLDLTDSGLYLPFAEGRPEHATALPGYTALSRLALVPVQQVVGIPASKLKPNSKMLKALKAAGWQELTPVYIQGVVDMPRLLSKEAEYTVRTWRTNQLSELRLNLIRHGIRDAEAGKMWPGFKELYDALRPHMTTFTEPVTWNNAGRPHSLDVLKAVLAADQWARVEKVLAIGDTLRQVLTAFFAGHPLLAYINGTGNVDCDMIRDYVNR